MVALQGFVADHLGSSLDDLYVDMMRGRLPEDTFGLIARAVSTWGTARPYLAVSTLAVHTAQHWRVIRAHLINHGIADPMELPSMHVLLDVTEQLEIESIQGSTPAETARKRSQFYDRLYTPERNRVSIVNGPSYTPADAGLSDPEIEDAFDEFARAAPASG